MVTSEYCMWLSKFLEMNSDYLYCHKLLSVVLFLSHFSVIWNNQGRMNSILLGFVSIVCSTKYMSNAMKKLAAEAEHKKTQRLELEKWTAFLTDGVQEERVCRGDKRGFPAPILGQQSEVSHCFAFLFEEYSCVEVHCSHVINYPADLIGSCRLE